MNKSSKWLAFLVAVLALGASACGPGHYLQHYGYTSKNTVWYHWVTDGDVHSIIVCDLQPDGSEINCVESPM